jgi:hypothetical protein
MSKQLVEAFAKAHRHTQQAFNDGDFETAFAGLAPDVEWELMSSPPESGGPIKGKQAVIGELREMLNWHVGAQEFIDVGESRVLVHQRGAGTGLLTRIAGETDFFQESGSMSGVRTPCRPWGWPRDSPDGEDVGVLLSEERAARHILPLAHLRDSWFWRSGPLQSRELGS